ncbi:T-cell leukemia/lymphoma protein 1A [Marmota monax]|uniref:T-cell leukemia/lymphoma protein 1A n=1 Tax=Marmota monax TaxID=9995 RepID=UPI001EB03016|nr:T-cell leukemia/lymphoma protein 1A [Marmota monax]
MEGFPFEPDYPPDPDHLWRWNMLLFVDETYRTWLPIIIKVHLVSPGRALPASEPRPSPSSSSGPEEPLLSRMMEGSLQVLMRQEDYPLDNPLSPTEMTPSLLPLLYQLYPERRYRGSDSSLWRIVYHIEYNRVEDMLLEMLPTPE